MSVTWFSGGGSGGGGVTDHGMLTGLGDDDHTQYHNDARALTWIGTRSTTDLPEGSNLYFTAERTDDRVAALIQSTPSLTWVYDDGANTLTGTVNVTQYTDEMAQDAVGTILTDTASIDFTYNDGTPSITAAVLPAGVDHNSLANLTTGDPHTQYLKKASNLSDVASASTSRTNLGLGDLATLNTVGTTQIDADSVTYPKIQNVTTNNRLLGRATAGAGDVEEITLGTNLSFTGTTLNAASTGDVLAVSTGTPQYTIPTWGSTAKTLENGIAIGTAGQLLTSGGAGVAPTFATYTGTSSLVTTGTITTGTWGATTIAVDKGGSDRTSATAYAVLCGGTTSTGAHQSIASVGNAGEVLTSNGAGALPTMQAGPAMVLIASATASSSATIDFTGLTSAYNHYILTFNGVIPQTDDTFLLMRTSTNGGSSYDSGASDYAWVFDRIIAGTGSTVTTDAADAQLSITPQTATVGLGTGTGEAGNGHIVIYKPSSTAYCAAAWEMTYICSAGTFVGLRGNGLRLTSADVDAVRLFMSSGNIASGEFKLYGVKNA